MTSTPAAKRWLMALVLLLGLAVAAPAQDAAPEPVADPGADALPAEVDLRPNFVAGRTARYQIWTLRKRVTSATFDGNSRSSEMRIDVNGEVTWTVQNVNADGSATCLMTIDWVTSDVTMPDGSLQRNDSRQASGDIPPMHNMLRAMAGVPLMFRVSADGLVQSVNGADAIRRMVGEGVPPPEDLDFIESASDLALVPAGLAQASLNESWRTPFVWNHELGKLHYDASYQLGAIEELAGVPVATVSGSAQVRLEAQVPELPPDVAPPAISMTDADFKTQIMFDLARHEAVGRNTVERRTIQVTVDVGGGRRIETAIAEEIHSQALRIQEH